MMIIAKDWVRSWLDYDFEPLLVDKLSVVNFY